MEFIKKHRFTVFIIGIFIVCVIVTHYLFNLFFINSGKPEYGNRLDGIENVEILQKDLDAMEESIKKNSVVKKVNLNTTGRILDIVITVEDSTSLKDSKKIGQDSFAVLSDRQKEYYSVQVFIKKESEKQNNFPIIGYKQKGTKNLIWTKDRGVTKSDENK